MDNEQQMPVWAKELMDKVIKLEKENAMLKDFAGKNKITSWVDAQRDFKNKFVHFKKHNNKIVIGWSNLDYSEFNPRAVDALSENLKTTLYFLDGTKETVNYLMFKNDKELIKCKLIRLGDEFSIVEFSPDVVEEYKLPKNSLDVETKFLNA